MARASMENVVQHLRGLAAAPDVADSVLLEQFLSRRDEMAFEALVRRHGPMVLGVCRRVLANPADAEDAFQATFLVLVRKAGSIARRELLGNWLYGVAYHTARAARTAAGRRRAREAQVMPRPQPSEADDLQDLLPLLDQELSRLPDKYRVPVVFCDLEGKSRREAAQALGIAEGTLSSRLSRARALLQRRFRRRGLTLTAAALAAGLGQPATAASVPSALLVQTVRAGGRLLAGSSAAAGVFSARVIALSERAVKTMLLTKLKLVTTALLLAAVTVGTGTLVSSRLPGGEGGRAVAAPVGEPAGDPTLRQALDTARVIGDPELRCEMLLRVAKAQQETGDADGARKTRQAALETAKSFANGRRKVSALAEVAVAQAEAGDRDARPTLRLAEQVAAAVADDHEKGNALIWLARVQGHLGDYEAGLRTVKDSGDYQATALWMFAAALDTKDRAAARKALQEASVVAKAQRDGREKHTALKTIARAQAQLGDAQAALRTADAADAATRREVLEAVAVGQANRGDVVGALRTVAALGPDRGQTLAEPRANALLAVAIAQAKAGDRAAAQATLRDVRDIADRLPQAVARGRRQPFGPITRFPRQDDLRGSLARAQVQMGDFDGARQTLSAIASDYEKARALLAIGSAQLRAGKQADARATLRAAAEAVPAVVDPRNDWPPASGVNATLRQIGEQQAKAGAIDEALRTAAAITTDHERDVPLAAVAAAQAAAGDMKAAQQTLAKIQSDSWKAWAVEHMAQARAKAGDQRGAMALAADQPSAYLKAHALLGASLARAKPKAAKQ